MFVIERLAASAAIFAAAHFAMGFINSSAGGSGGSLLFPFATNVPSRWVFGALDGMLGLLVPMMIGLAAIAVLTFFLAFFAALGIWVPANLWRPLVGSEASPGRLPQWPKPEVLHAGERVGEDVLTFFMIEWQVQGTGIELAADVSIGNDR